MTPQQPPHQRPTPATAPPVRAAATTQKDAPTSSAGADPMATQTGPDTAVVATVATEPKVAAVATDTPVATPVCGSMASGHADQPSSGLGSECLAGARSAAKMLSQSLGWVMRSLERGWRASARAVRRLCVSGPLLVALGAVFMLTQDGLSRGWVVAPIAQILPTQGGQQVPIAQNLDQVLTGLRNLLMLYLVPVTIVILTAAWMRYGASRKAENAEQAKEAVSKALIGFCGAALSPVIVEVLRIIVRGAS